MPESQAVATVDDIDSEVAALVVRAEAGNGAAACRLGDLYREGQAVRFAARMVFHWYARGALAGDPEAQNNLGACYERGVGCPKNYKLSFTWYLRSAEKGSSTAQFSIGMFYLLGRGVEQSLDAARFWMHKAAGQDEPGAEEQLRSMLREEQ